MILLTISCGGNITTNKIIPYKLNKSKTIDNNLKLCNYVILQNKLLSNIQKIITHDNKIYILDLAHGNLGQLVVFDNQGNYMYNVSQSGKGPGEYVELRDFTIKNDTIFILDGMTDDILRFVHDTSFVDKIHLPIELSTGIATINGGLILHRPLYYDESPKGLHAITIVNDLINIEMQKYMYDGTSRTINYANSLQESGENIVFAQILTDKVYVFNKNDTNIDSYNFDFGAHSVSELNTHEYDDVFNNNRQYRYFISVPVLVDGKLIGHIDDLGKKKVFVYNIHSQEFIVDNTNVIPVNSAWLSYYGYNQVAFDITQADAKAVSNYPYQIKNALKNDQNVLAIYNVL